MSLKNILLSLVLALAMLGLGAWLGMTLGGQKTSALSQITRQVSSSSTLAKSLSSKVVPSISAYGQVTNVSSNSLTVSYQEDSVIIPVASDAKIYSFIATVPPALKKGKPAPAPTSQVIALQDVKVGNTVSVSMRVLPNGQLQALSIVIPPATSTTK